jgi:hypothetical protein
MLATTLLYALPLLGVAQAGYLDGADTYEAHMRARRRHSLQRRQNSGASNIPKVYTSVLAAGSANCERVTARTRPSTESRGRADCPTLPGYNTQVQSVAPVNPDTTSEYLFCGYSNGPDYPASAETSCA